MMKSWKAIAVCATLAGAAFADDVKVGIIGIDTSHASAFAGLLNRPNKKPEHEGFKVVAAYQWGSRDIKSSIDRYPRFLKDMERYGVEMVDSIPALLAKVDAVLLETNDGRLHLEQALEVVAAVALVGEPGRAGEAGALGEGVVGEVVVQDEIARAEEEAQGGHVGGMPAHVGNAVLGAEEVAQGLLELAVRGALAADQAAGAGRGAEDFCRCRHGLGDLWMPVDVEVVVGGEVDVVLAVDMYGCLGRTVGTVEERVRQAHLRAELYHPLPY